VARMLGAHERLDRGLLIPGPCAPSKGPIAIPFARPSVSVNERPITAHLDCGKHQRQHNHADQPDNNECATRSHAETERSNSATPGRGLKPTRDFPANPSRFPALAAVIWFGDPSSITQRISGKNLQTR